MIGYNSDFIGHALPLPKLHCQTRKAALNNGELFDYLHFSLMMHQARRHAIFVAHNVDQQQLKTGIKRSKWKADKRLGKHQLDNGFFKNNPWDRGHLARRLAVAWGGDTEARRASRDTFYYTNASPQHHNFNTDEWLKLEDWVLAHRGSANGKLSVFTGPVNTDKDPHYRGSRIPAAYWKIIVFIDVNGTLQTRAFLMVQTNMLQDTNGAQMIKLTNYQVTVTEITQCTGLQFAAAMYPSNPCKVRDGLREIHRAEDIRH